MPDQHFFVIEAEATVTAEGLHEVLVCPEICVTEDFPLGNLVVDLVIIAREHIAHCSLDQKVD